MRTPQQFSILIVRNWNKYPLIHILLYFSEFLDTAVTDNNWVCDLATRVPDLYTYGCVGLILGKAFKMVIM